MTCFGFKIIKYKMPRDLYDKILFRADVHNVNLRRRYLVTVPQHRKEMFKRSFSYNIASLINSLDEINFDQSVLAFKKTVKERLLHLQ